jgi:hypothetical protein
MHECKVIVCVLAIAYISVEDPVSVFNIPIPHISLIAAGCYEYLVMCLGYIEHPYSKGGRVGAKNKSILWSEWFIIAVVA